MEWKCYGWDVVQAPPAEIDIEGRCLCGDLRYRASGAFRGIAHCHCSRCRKAHGASFASFVFLQEAELSWVPGSKIPGRYRSSITVERAFCPTCGSALPNAYDQAHFAWLSLPAGNMLNMPPAPINYHVYTDSRAWWYEIPAAADQYPTVPDGWRDPGLEELKRPSTSGNGKLDGSCLCGDVRFDVSDPVFMMNCHCTRCRLSRSAAHATNLFAPRASLNWISGEGQVNNYRLPEAARFGVGFCRHCSGLVPRTNSDSELANIPAGCLDTDPALTPRGHIHTGTKAAWFEIVDSLPVWETTFQPVPQS